MKLHAILGISVNFINLRNFHTFAGMGSGGPPTPLQLLSSGLSGVDSLSPGSPWDGFSILSLGVSRVDFLEKLVGIKGGGLFDPPLVPASLLCRTLSSHHPLHPWIRIQCHLRCRKLHLVALKFPNIDSRGRRADQDVWHVNVYLI